MTRASMPHIFIFLAKELFIIYLADIKIAVFLTEYGKKALIRQHSLQNVCFHLNLNFGVRICFTSIIMIFQRASVGVGGI